MFTGIQRPLFIKKLKNGSSSNMAVDASSTSQVFKIAPASNEIIRITNWMIYIQDAKGFNVNYFGSSPSLTNGLMPRLKVNDSINNMFEDGIKKNSDIASVTYDMQVHDFGGSGTDDILVAQIHFERDLLQSIRLDGSQNSELQVLVSDDLTSLTRVEVVAQGYYEKWI